MTEPASRPSRRRASRSAIRFWAWVTGGLAFLAPFGALAEGSAGGAAQADQRVSRELVIRRITRRVVIHDAPVHAPVRYVYVPAASSSTPSAGSAPAPAPAPATTTGGS